MSKESIGIFHRSNRSAVQLSPLPKLAMEEANKADLVRRLAAICFPLRLQYCFSDGLQKGLFQIMEMIASDNSLVASLLSPLISFIESADAENMIWASACESGFAFNFVRKLLLIAPPDDREAIAGFIVHKIEQLVDQLVTTASDVGGLAFLSMFLQELLHVVAASSSIGWINHQTSLSNAGRRLMQFCSPFQEDPSILLSLKTLLCFRTVLDQLFQAENTIAIVDQLSCEAFYEAAELVMSVAVDWNKSTLYKVALQVVLKSSALLDSARFQVACQQLASFILQYPINPIRMLLTHCFSHHLASTGVDKSAGQTLSVNALVLSRDLSDLLKSFEMAMAFTADRSSAVTTIAVGSTKFLMAMIQGESIFDTSQLSLSFDRVDLQDFDAVGGELLQQIAIVLVQDYEQNGKSDSYCFHFLKSLIHVVENTFYTDKNLPVSNVATTALKNAELALSFFCAMIRFGKNENLIDFGYKELSKTLQKKLSGRLLSLASIGLADILVACTETSTGAYLEERANQVMAVLFKVEERVVYHVEQWITASHKQTFTQHEFDQQALDLIGRAKGVCAGFHAIGKFMVQQTTFAADLHVKSGVLIDRFLHVLTELLPKVKNNHTYDHRLAQFVVDLSLLFLPPSQVMLEGLLHVELNASSVEESFSRLTRYIRLWIGLSVVAVKVSAEMETFFDQVVAQLAKITPPFVFGKLLGVSKSTDLGDELVMNDPVLERLLRDCVSTEDRTKLHFVFGASYEGLTPASFYLLNAARTLESSRVTSVADIRPLVGYFCDLHNWFSPAKRSAIVQLTKKVEEIWIQTVFLKLSDVGYSQEEEVDEENDDRVPSVRMKPQMVVGDDQYGLSLENFQYFMEDQVTYLIERCMDDRDEVRSYCSSLLLRLIAELPWMVANPCDLIVFCLESLSLLEKAMHAATAYNAHEQTSFVYPNDDYLLSLEEDKDRRDQDASFITLLRFRRVLPVLSFPLREDRIAAVSTELITVIYAWLSAPTLSQSLKDSILQSYVSKHDHKDGQLALAIALEMLAAARPTFHTQHFGGSLFDKFRSHAAHKVVAILDKRKHSSSKFAHWAIKDSMVLKDASNLQASKAEIDAITSDLENGSDTGGLIDLLGNEAAAHRDLESSTGLRSYRSFVMMLQKVIDNLDIVQAEQASERDAYILDSIRQLDALVRILYSRIRLQPELWSAHKINALVTSIVETIANIAAKCQGSDAIGRAVLGALEHAYAVFSRQRSQIIAVIASVVGDVCTTSLGTYQVFPHSLQYLLRFVGIIASAHSTVAFLTTRSIFEMALHQISQSGNEAHLSCISTQLAVFLGLQSLQTFHSQQHTNLSVACNRILRENVFASVALLATRQETDSHQKEKLFAASFTITSSSGRNETEEEYDDEVRECTNWCKLLYLLMEDTKRWYVDYDRKQNEKPAKLRSTSSMVSLGSGEESAIEGPHSTIYFGPEAAFDIVINQLCRFSHSFRKLQSLHAFSSGYVREPAFENALQNLQAYGLKNLTSSGLNLEAKKTEQLLGCSGVLSALYMVIAHRIDFLHARSLSTYRIIILDSAETIEALEIVEELKKLVDLSLANSVSVYKFSTKALWMISPALAFSFKQIYHDLSLKDGRRKGINHLALFLSRHLEHVSTLRDYRVLPLLLDVINHKDATDADRSICLNAIDILDDCPLYFALQMLNRCDPYHQQVWNNKSQNTMGSLMRYLQRVLYRTDMQLILFYLPQLVQLLRRDYFGTLSVFLTTVAATSPTICHQLVWSLQTECKSSRDENHAKLLKTTGKNKANEVKHGLCGQLSGLDPLPTISRQLIETITESLPDQDYHYLQDEMSLFNYITDISSKLKEIPHKDTHGAVVKELLENIAVPEGAYLPTNPYRRVKAIQLDSAKPMQSAAKCPFLLKFQTVRWRGPDAYIEFVNQREINSSPAKDDGNDVIMDGEPKLILRTKSRMLSGIGKKSGTFTGPRGGINTSEGSESGTGTELLDRPGKQFRTPERRKLQVDADNVTKSSGNVARHLPSPFINRGAAGNLQSPAKLLSPFNRSKSPHAAFRSTWDDQKDSTEDACIFKTHDDCRQDLLTLQIIRLLKNWFLHCGLPVYVVPYHIVCNRTGNAGIVGGILEVVKHVSSRDQMGKGGAKTLLQHFVTHFGQVGSESFHNAQLAFARSLAPYAVICHILHIKDRHNGNIMFDREGHIIHIDFGFILGISPGHNMGFEAAPFKLSKEMVDVMGGRDSEAFKQFAVLAIQCFLAAREVMESIVAMICAFGDSDLPCFQFKESVLERLLAKFVPHMTEQEAGEHMSRLVRRAMSDWTASAYDGVQKLQNNIYSAEWR